MHGEMKRSLIHILAVFGTALLFYQISMRLFGLREILLSHPAWRPGYLAVITILAVYGYRRIFGQEDETGEKPCKTKRHDTPTEEEIADIRRTFRRPAVVLRSTLVTELPEGYVSCLGRVTWQLPGEEWPTDADGKRLEPLATLFVPDLPAVPEPLRKVALITIYAPFENDIDPAEDPMMGCVVRSYTSLEGLQACDAVSSEWKTCLLTPVSVENDMPTGGGIDDAEAADEWDRFEEKFGDDCYDKQVCHAHYGPYRLPAVPSDDLEKADLYAVFETHKFGGHPTYCQEAPEREADYPFVLQINSDAEAGLDIGDCGSYYFYYNAKENKWQVHEDFY